MEAGQKKFFEFVLERVRSDKRREAQSMLLDSFDKQVDGTFDRGYLDEFNRNMVTLLKPEYVDELSSIMAQFGAAHVSSQRA